MNIRALLSIVFVMEKLKKICAVSIQEKFNMSAVEMISAQGFPGEEYTVITPDGYILLLHRIPHGKVGPSDQKKPPFYLQHGYKCESSIWIEKNDSLAFLLAELGYDVWLGNLRGNRYSAHVKLSREAPEFYDFTWDDHAKYDLPSQWDFVLEKTGYDTLKVIGLSLGVWSTLANLASDDKYQAKISVFFALAPVSRLTYSTNSDFRFLTLILPLANLAQPRLLIPFGNTPPSCIPNCTDFGSLINKHCNSGSSLKSAIHGLQLLASKEVSYFDFGTKFRNLLHYFSFWAPAYDLTKVRIPIYMYSSINDNLADPLDVALLRMDLPNVIRHRIVQDELFDHQDFMAHANANDYVYQPLLQDIKEFEDSNN